MVTGGLAGCRELVGTALVEASDSLIDPLDRRVSTANRSQLQGGRTTSDRTAGGPSTEVESLAARGERVVAYSFRHGYTSR
ncbi:hypothetical protein VB716_16705, partial [Synechococcus sp. CCY9201]|uniref:hypothetical protein n=1 Tax=Synechococcus sp. CCY9201 TaxID=174697 RepID=UPI002B1F038E